MANLASAMTPPMKPTARLYSQDVEQQSEHVSAPCEVSQYSTIFYHHLGVETPFDPQHRYVTSYLLPVPLLAAWRSTVAIYMTVTVLATAAQEGIGSITYFTSLSYWGVTTYFVMSAVHTCSFWYSQCQWNKARNGRSRVRIEMLERAYPLNGVGRIDVARHNIPIESVRGDGNTDHSNIEMLLTYTKKGELEVGSTYPRSLLSSKFSRPLQFAHSLLVSTVASYPLVVTVIFWTVLAGSAPLATPYGAFVNISKHTINVVLTQLDLTVLSRTPMMPWWHLIAIVAFLGMYMGIVAITWERYHVLVYSFFNTQQFGVPLVVVFCIVLVVFAIVSFLLSQLLFLIREYVAAKIQRSGGWGSAKAMSVSDDACIPTRRGPGPLGGGGRRKDITQDTGPLRGRFPVNALVNHRSSAISMGAIDTRRLTRTVTSDDFDVMYRASDSASPRHVAFEPVEALNSRSKLDLLCENYSRSTQTLHLTAGGNKSDNSLHHGIAV